MKLLDYAPYKFQSDFHEAGVSCPERMLMAANRVGKTWAACAETAFHLTGLYPDWWNGRVFDHPVEVWSGSLSNMTSRDIIQKALLGQDLKYNLGTGLIPKPLIMGKPKTRQAGISDVVDTCLVGHVSGGTSKWITKTYEQGWSMWQSGEPHVVQMDEEPSRGAYPTNDDYKIFTEAQTRILTSHGVLMVTFTPLYGLTPMVEHFQKGLPGTWLGNATWDDASHLDEQSKKDLLARYPDHERDTRSKGIPMVGEGRVFTLPEEEIKVKPFEIPRHFRQIKGIDFGIDHPATVADLAWDLDRDVIYLTRCWRKRNATKEEHIEAINAVNTWVPVSWPHDGANREKSNGTQLKNQYRGVKMLSMSACYDKEKLGRQPVEPIVLEMQERIASGGFKAFDTCSEFFEEYRNYHRKDGHLSKIKDDVLKAVFYGVMMRRYAMPDFKPSPRHNVTGGPIFRGVHG